MIAAYLAEKKQLIEEHLQTIWPEQEEKASVIFQAMDYSLLAGGKRLRPILFLTTLEAFGMEETPYLPFACALEMIHTYSLIHDDLPAMDNDDLRRGKPTCHKAFGEDLAILAGDGLLTHSFAQMTSIAEKLPPGQHILLLRAIQEVALSAGVQGMVVGQVLDLSAEKAENSVDLMGLQQIHRYKTGALFASAIISAGILAGANQEELQALRNYANAFGLAFQIEDDILDVIGDAKKLGKPIGSDEKNQKVTYPLLLGLEESKNAAKKAAETAIQSIKPLGIKANRLQELVTFLLQREY